MEKEQAKSQEIGLVIYMYYQNIDQWLPVTFFFLPFFVCSHLEGKLAEVLSGILGSESQYINIMQISKEPDAVEKEREGIHSYMTASICLHIMGPRVSLYSDSKR